MTERTRWKIAFFSLLVTFIAIIFIVGSELSKETIKNSSALDSIAIRTAELKIIRLDLNEYSNLSTATKDEITNAIGEASNRYKLPPALLHAIFQIESDYRFNVDHPTVKIKINDKLTTVNCRGLGGILWEVWRKELQTEGIAETSSDLYYPKNNVMATGYILRSIINQELSKSSNDWIVRRVITRYYGATSPQYEQKMRLVTSNLWLKRIAREIEQATHHSDKTKTYDVKASWFGRQDTTYKK